ncbi:MAG: ATP synthase F1 subunit delta [Bacteroidetes bacterium]|nr:MAG: ATP synthase F1 subunit delta [Bacteroidota bacterium]
MMLNPRVANRYALALLDVAKEVNLVNQVYADAQSILDVCASNADFVQLLKSPIIKGDKKLAIFDAVFASANLQAVTSKFVRLMTSKGREELLKEIMQELVKEYQRLHNIKQYKLTTAVQASTAVKEQIVNQVKQALGAADVQLTEVVDETIVGGFILEAEGIQIDGSVRNELLGIKQQFLSNEFVANIR